MAGKKNERKPRNTQCLNCGTSLDSDFCPICGQKNKDYRLSFKDLFSDFVEEILDVDSRLIQSVKYLFTRPGLLTTEYVAGRRVSYLPPLRIYLVASVLFFLSLSLKTVIPELRSNRILHELVESTTQDSVGLFADSTRLEELLVSSFDERQDRTGYLQADTAASAISISVGESQLDLQQGDFLADFTENFAQMMFLLLPVAALLMKLLYWRRKKLYVEHLIFSLHVHAFIFSLLIFTVILNFKIITWLVMIWSLIYLYLAMKRYYGQSHVKTSLKMTLLLLSYGLSLALVMAMTLLGTVFGKIVEKGG